ncbi:hypothetical protein ACT3CD_07315 [Geofilum sp. OHC36d9]|uniref:hypothetical protein n=1 Tax=Geofilum sp. OHC36d9 TaxID=3458413 RepID=UPI00403353CB
MIRFLRIWVMLMVVIAAGWGCERDYSFRGGDEGISFSTDTVMFDTIFTSIGSATRYFRVYNPYGADMVIDCIKLVGGEDSKFRINVDGIADVELNDVELRSGDSLFVFVEVTIDPGEGVNTPFVVTDSVEFITKEKVQNVKLVAYGQDVVVMRQQKLATTQLTAEKPYLIYDWIEVDSMQTLTIDAGARLYFYQDAFLNVRSGASLVVNGTREEPVLFAGSRLEEWYTDIPGQWGYIYLMPGSKNSLINYATIRNATIGLVVDSVGLDNSDPLIISNTRIEHSAKQGLLAQTSAIRASNSLFGDCGSASVALTLGGEYDFYHCTIANYFNWKFRGTPALVLSNYMEESAGIEIYDLTANFYNCIVYGQAGDEFGRYFEGGDTAVVDYKFDHVLLRSSLTDDELADKTHFNAVIVNESPFFVSTSDFNYQLDTLSVAVDAGSSAYAGDYSVDYAGNNRLDDVAPDLGFMERIERQ